MVPPAADLLLNRIKRCDKRVVKDTQTIIIDTGENAICDPYDTVALHNKISRSAYCGERSYASCCVL